MVSTIRHTKVIAQPTLDDIITFSCGIGRSHAEAEDALFGAKEYKKRHQWGDRLEYNIFVYDGPRLKDEKKEDHPQVNDYENILRFCLEKSGSEEVIKAVKSLAVDAQTGLSNRMGYQYERKLLAERGYDQGHVLIFDGNGMKPANDKFRYDDVTKLLAAAGKAVSQTTRGGHDRRENGKIIQAERRQAERRAYELSDVAGCRIHNDAGDEFLIFIPDPNKMIETPTLQILAERILNRMYNNQREVLKSFY